MTDNNPFKFLLLIKKGLLKDARALLNNDFTVLNALDDYGSNALIEAIIQREEVFACDLLQLGINFNISDKMGRTPEFLAQKIGLFNVVKKIEDLKLKNAGLQITETYENPLAKLNGADFTSFEVPMLYSFPILMNCATLKNTSDVRTFICFYKNEFQAVKEYNNNIMAPHKKEFIKAYTEIFVVDILPSPFRESEEESTEEEEHQKRRLFLTNLKGEDSFNVRKQQLNAFNIIYIADYDVEHILYTLKDLCSSF